MTRLARESGSDERGPPAAGAEQEDEPFEGARAVDRILHEARSSSIAMGAILRLVRQRLDTLAGEERARCIEEIELLSRTAERLDRLCVRSRALVRARRASPTTVGIDEILAGIEGALRMRGQRGRAVVLATDVDLAGAGPAGGGATIETDPDLLWNLIEELVDVAVSAGTVATIRATATGAGVCLALEIGAWPDGLDERELTTSVAGVLAARLGASVLARRAAGGVRVVVELPRAWP